MKVKFRHKSGRVQEMALPYAEILAKLKRGSYLTRDMTAIIGKESAAIEPELNNDDGLDILDVDELREIAKDRGVKVHHAAGAEKIREALRKAEA